MENKIVRARIRDMKDADLREALAKIPIYYDESDIIREALRQFLFGHKGRKPQIVAEDILDETIVMNQKKIELEDDDGNEDDEEVVLEEVDISDEELEAKLDGQLGI